MKSLKGFTVIELLVVATFVGIIASVVAPLFMDKKIENTGASRHTVSTSYKEIVNQAPATETITYRCIGGILLINDQKTATACTDTENKITISVK